MSDLVESATDMARNGSAGRARAPEKVRFEATGKTAVYALCGILGAGGIFGTVKYAANDVSDHDRRIAVLEAQQLSTIETLKDIRASVGQTNGLVQQVLINQSKRR